MSETAQIIIVGVITVLTLVLAIVGFQIIFVLQELRRTLMKVNNTLDEVETLTSKITHSTESVSGLFMGLRTALSLLTTFKKNKDK